MWWAILLLFIPSPLAAKNFTNCIMFLSYCQCSPELYFTHSSTACYQELYDPETRKHCCRNLSSFCPVTRLHTGYSPITIKSPLVVDYFLYTWTNKTDREEYYEDPISKNACPIPYSYTTFRFLKALPVNFSLTRATPLPHCKSHSDCPVGTYCGYSVNPSFVTPNISKEQRREQQDRSKYSREIKGGTFCYENFLKMDKLELVLLPDKRGLKACDSIINCPRDQFCYVWDVREKLILATLGVLPYFYKGSSFRRFGICAYAHVCEPPMTKGRLSKYREFCKNESDCDDIGNGYQPECVKFKNQHSFLYVSLCCYKAKKCEFGIPENASGKCITTKDCNLLPDGNVSTAIWTKWCDNQGFCCHDPTNKINGLCPDGAIYAFHEAKCESATEADITSGICTEQPDAKCKYGHCCPGLERKNGLTTLTNSSYVTNVDCDPMEKVPEKLHFSFCNETKIIIIGLLDMNGNEFVRDERNINCQINENCTEIGLKYCVRESNTDLYCYRDPFIKIRENSVHKLRSDSKNWHLIILTFVPVFVFIGICILYCVLKRSKCRKRSTRTIRNKKSRIIGTTKTAKSLESKTQ